MIALDICKYLSRSHIEG